MNKKSICLTAFFLTVSMILMVGCTDTSPENPAEITTAAPVETTVSTLPADTTVPLETVTVSPTTEPSGDETDEPPVTTGGVSVTTTASQNTTTPPQIATETTTTRTVVTTAPPATTTSRVVTTTSRAATTTTPRATTTPPMTTTARPTTTTARTTTPPPIERLHSDEALQLFAKGVEAEVLDIDTGITYRVRRSTAGYNEIADVETLTRADTDRLLQTNGGNWGPQRRAIIVTIGNRRIAASIAPFPHTGCECCPFGALSDHLNGNVGPRPNLNSIFNTGLTGVVDIHFFGSLVPGLRRPDAQHQAQVVRAAAFNG